MKNVEYVQEQPRRKPRRRHHAPRAQGAGQPQVVGPQLTEEQRKMLEESVEALVADLSTFATK